jgi:spore coat protein CotH
MARPAFEDKDYWAGDTAIIKTGAVFGPYIEGQTTDADAWPEFVTVANGVFIFDKTTGQKYELSVDNGNVEFLKEVP